MRDINAEYFMAIVFAIVLVGTMVGFFILNWLF
jgi:hypothetical protein